MDNTTQTTGVTESELNAYLSQGCAFLPASGWWSSFGAWSSGGVGGFYWSSTEYGSNDGIVLTFDPGRVKTAAVVDKTECRYSVRLVRE